MCEKCFEKEYKKFPSYTDFENFEKVLDKKCKNNILKIDIQSNELIDFRMYYQCTFCKEKWVMSIPENAWRGYFLTEKNALKYHLQLEKEKKERFINLIIIIILGVFLYFIFK